MYVRTLGPEIHAAVLFEETLIRLCRKTPALAQEVRLECQLLGKAHYPLSLPPYCKAFMAFLGFWRSASLRSAIY